MIPYPGLFSISGYKDPLHDPLPGIVLYFRVQRPPYMIPYPGLFSISGYKDPCKINEYYFFKTYLKEVLKEMLRT